MESKKLENIPARSSVFVDTNILIYHLLEDEIYGESCHKFLNRVEKKELLAFISPIVISETLFIYLAIRHKTPFIATLDNDFNGINGIEVFKPGHKNLYNP